jgi:ribosome-associated toxin RatA of RatAB toxin-antitoxin module
MFRMTNDEFVYTETAKINAPLSLVYETIAGVTNYGKFLTDVALSEMESGDVCHMVLRAGPLRVSTRTKVTYEENKRIDFVMLEGPPLEHLSGSWQLEESDFGTSVTFEGKIKAGRAGNWLLKMASRYVERKSAALIDAFRQQVLKEQQRKESAAVPSV